MYMSKISLKEIIEENLSKVLTEGRVETVKSSYHENSHPAVDWLSEQDPSGNNKYLPWMSKQSLFSLKELQDKYPDNPDMVSDYGGRWYMPGEKIREMFDLIQYFHENTHRYQKKDINQFKDLDELRDATEIAKTNLSRKEMKDQGGHKVYEDDNFILIHPKTHEASCKYGSKTRWCVTMRGYTGYFERYSTNGPLFFLIDKRRIPASNSPQYMRVAPDYYKVAIHYQPQFNSRYKLNNDDDAYKWSKALTKDAFVDSASINNVDIDYWNVQDKNVSESVFKKYLGGPGKGQKQRADQTNNALNRAMETYTKKLLSDFYDSTSDIVDNSEKINELRREINEIDRKRDKLVDFIDSLETLVNTLGYLKDMDTDDIESFSDIFSKLPFDDLEEIEAKLSSYHRQYDEYTSQLDSNYREIDVLEKSSNKPFAFYDLEKNIPQE